MASFVKEEAEDASMNMDTWTTSFGAQFSWLLSSSNSISIVHQQEQENEAIEVKLQEIRTCLDGNDGNATTVDLWQLRELALSRGGLLSHHVRKRAWPKLMGAHQQILLHAAQDECTEAQLVEITQNDMNLLQEEVSQPTVWNIEDHVWRNRMAEHEKQVTFLPGLTSLSPTPSMVNVDKNTSNNAEETTPPMTASTPRSEMYISSSNTPPPPLLPRSAHEEKALLNTLVSLLRTPPLECDTQTPDKEHYHYFRGLHNLTAVLLINLESPSLTCLILKKLATYSLRDALFLNTTTQSMYSTTNSMVNALLEKANVDLYHHCMDVMCDAHDNNVVTQVILAWIPSWFTSHISNFQMASRLVDVFVVSHAAMPM